MGELLSLGKLSYQYGVKMEAEAAVNAARLFKGLIMTRLSLNYIDFMNSFNMLQRDKMLLAAEEIAPDFFPFVYSSYMISFLCFIRETKH